MQRELDAALLVREEPALAVTSAAVSREAAIGVDHAMTWNDDGDAIVAIRAADRPGSAGTIQTHRDRVVRGRPAERNLQELRPDARLKGASLEHERDRKGLAPAQEVFVELSLRLVENGMRTVVRHAAADALHPLQLRGEHEIGRASCRERGSVEMVAA